MSIETFDLGNVQIEAIINGTGEIIILIAAGGQDASSFNDFTPLLNKAGYKTVAINRRGFGGSKGSLEDLTLHDLANDIAGVIQMLGGNAVHVLGWAFGNRVARCLAEDHPHLVKTVILLAAGGQVPPEPETSKKIAILGNPNSSSEERLEALRFWLFSPSTDIETVIQVFRGRKTWPKAQQAHNKASQATPLKEWCNGGQAPILVIQGLDDKAAVPENGNILKREYSERVKLVDIENAGHFMIYEQPKEVAQEILSFLSNF
ncbi:MAG: alpha/beta hydrolase [Candidatus Lokiarchaeota archaeon]|nr:alpha/beta hydrolase [Candidatus Lokiarchaeota archaeon]